MSDNLETLMNIIGKKVEEVSQKSEKKKIDLENEVIIVENKNFDYESLERETALFLKEKQDEILNLFNRTYTGLGRILKEAQERLKGSNQHDGLFYKWFTSLGFKKDKVYALIGRYNLLIGNSDKQEIIEKLPLSVTYELSKKNFPEELKGKVLNGEIKSFKELKQALEESHLVKISEGEEKKYNSQLLNLKIEFIKKQIELIENINLDNIKREGERERVIKAIETIKNNLEFLHKYM